MKGQRVRVAGRPTRMRPMSGIWMETNWLSTASNQNDTEGHSSAGVCELSVQNRTERLGAAQRVAPPVTSTVLAAGRLTLIVAVTTPALR